jgi:hypothetical protein
MFTETHELPRKNTKKKCFWQKQIWSLLFMRKGYKQFVKGCILQVNKKWKLDESFPLVVRSAINNTNIIVILSTVTI